MLQDGVTDVKAFEPKPVMIGRSKVTEVYNDVELADVMRKTGIVTVPYHADLLDETDDDDKIPKATDLDNKVKNLFQNEELIPNFEDVFHEISPEKNILERDWEYYQLYRTYLHHLSYKYLERFFDQESKEIQFRLIVQLWNGLVEKVFGFVILL